MVLIVVLQGKDNEDRILFLSLLSIWCEVVSAALQPVPFLTVLAVLGVALGTLLVISSAGRTIYLYLALLKA